MRNEESRPPAAFLIRMEYIQFIGINDMFLDGEGAGVVE